MTVKAFQLFITFFSALNIPFESEPEWTETKISFCMQKENTA